MPTTPEYLFKVASAVVTVGTKFADYKPHGLFTDDKVEKAKLLAQAILDRVNAR